MDGVSVEPLAHSPKHPPQHEEEAEPDDGAEYDRVLPLLEVDLLDEAVDEGEAVGDVVELGAHGLKKGSNEYRKQATSI